MSKVRNWLFVSALFIGFSTIAQNTSIYNVLNTSGAKQNGTIIENEELVGYYMFYFKEKEDRKTSTYEIKVFDTEYKEMNSFEITRPKNTALAEMTYNGEAFMMFFIDKKTGYEYVTFDKDGDMLGSKLMSIKEAGKFDYQMTLVRMTSNTEGTSIYPLGSDGFVKVRAAKFKKAGYILTAYDNDLNELWTSTSSQESKMVESIEINEVNKKFLTAAVQQRKSATSRKMDTYYTIIDAKTGKETVRLDMGNDKDGKESVLKSFYDESLNKIVMVGEYYKPGDDILKDRSEGIFIQNVDKKGKVSNRENFAWKGEIARFKQKSLSAEARKELDDKFYLYFHDVVRTEDGKLFLIGEQFKKQVSAGGVALGVVAAAAGGTSTASAMEIRVMNMAILEFDADNVLDEYTLVEKKNTSVMLPAGMGMYGASFLGYYIASIGGFDYSFTSRDKASNKFTVVYTDYNRKEEGKSGKADKMLGVIQIEDNEMEAKRFPINTEAKTWWIQQGKPGFISVCEYDRKEKRLDVRLEELAF